MPITFVDSDVQDSVGALSLTFAIPAGAQANDFMVAFVKQSENTTGREWDDDGGGGNGWTRAAYNRTTGGRDQETAIYWKIHDGSETDPTFTWASGVTTEPMSGTLLVYRGVDIATPFTDLKFQWNQNDANPPNAGVTIDTLPATILVFHAATHDDITSPAAPTGYTMRTQVWNGANDDHRNHFTADLIGYNAGTGAYTPPDWQHTVANTTPEYHVYTMVLQEVQPLGITSAPSESTYGSTITLDGFGFEALQGAGKVEVWDDVLGTTKAVQTVNSWSDTSIEIVLTQGTLGNDDVFYLVVTNDSAEVSSPRQISLGITPYSAIISGIGDGPDHHWPLDGAYTDIVAGNDMTVSPINGGGSFVATKISEGTTQSWRCQNSRREAPNSNSMNGQTEVDRLMGGWIRLQSTQQGLACLYEEGGGVNNLAFFTGMGNVLIAQQADTGDDNVQAFSDIKLTENRTYHVLFRFSYTDVTKEFRMYLDGALQAVTDGNPLTATDLDAHSGDISFGGPGGSLEVAGTDVLFQSAEDCLYSNWVTWDESVSDADILDLFRRGAVPTVVIASDTEANMQAALDALTGIERPDAPLAIRVEEPSGGGDLALDADDIVFNERCTIFVEWRGGGTLTWKNLNGSNLVAEKAYATTGGPVTIINPATLTLTGLQPNTEVRVYEAGTQTEIGGVENSGASFALSVEVNSVDVVVHALGYQNQVIEGVDTSAGDVSLPIQQRVDRQYANA